MYSKSKDEGIALLHSSQRDSSYGCDDKSQRSLKDAEDVKRKDSVLAVVLQKQKQHASNKSLKTAVKRHNEKSSNSQSNDHKADVYTAAASSE